MSPVPKAILLPKLLPFDSVGIGYLLHKPLYPSVSSRAVVIPDEECTEPFVEANYKTTVSTKHDGSLVASLTHLFGLTFGKKRSNVIQIDAEAMMYRMLKDSDMTFHSMCEDKATREWINKMHRYGKAIYLVVGLQTLRQAHFRHEMLSHVGGGVETLLPLEVAALPIDAQLKAAASIEQREKGESRVSGIFGIEARRVKSTVRSEDEPALKDECSWSFTPERVKGGGQPTAKKICVTLHNFVDESELASEGESEDGDED